VRRSSCFAIAIEAMTLVGAPSVRAQSRPRLPQPAYVQPPTWHDRGYFNVSGWLQTLGPSFDVVERPIDFAEPAVVDTTYAAGAGAGFDVAGGVRVWRSLAVGIDVTRFSNDDSGTVSAQVPHPFYFNRLRPVAGSASGLTRAETGVHVQLTWLKPIRSRWQLAIAGGPSWFLVNRDLVRDVAVTETFPFDTAQFAGVLVSRESGRHVGANGGADLTYLLRRRVGVGFGINVAHANVPLADGASVSAGGVRMGGGMRFRF